MASDSAPGNLSARLAGQPAEIFTRVLDAIVAQLAPENLATLDVPSDELHQEILIPLLPAMLSDKAIRNHWREQKGNSFFSRLQSHMASDAPRPAFAADDFEIHVTASYSASADARALSDTLLSEESLRDLAANLVNTLLDTAWAELPVEEEATAAEAEAPPAFEPTSAVEPVPEAVPESVAAAAAETEALPQAAEIVEELEAVPAPAAVMPASGQIGVVLRAVPFRPQPWRTKHNPLAGNHAAPKFPNPLAHNPLERHSEVHQAARAFKSP